MTLARSIALKKTITSIGDYSDGMRMLAITVPQNKKKVRQVRSCEIWRLHGPTRRLCALRNQDQWTNDGSGLTKSLYRAWQKLILTRASPCYTASVRQWRSLPEAAKFRSWSSSQMVIAPAPLRPCRGWCKQWVDIHTGPHTSSKFPRHNALRHASGLTTPVTSRALLNVIL